jgi:hypothetical protein
VLNEYACNLEQPDAQVDTLEQEIQDVFMYLESLRPEVMAKVYERLLLGTAKQSFSTVKKILQSARTSPHSSVISKKGERDSQRPRSSDAIPILESQLSNLKDPRDPLEALAYFGGLQPLASILPQEPMGILEAMARHPRMPHGQVITKSRTPKGMASAIVKHLQEHMPLPTD